MSTAENSVTLTFGEGLSGTDSAQHLLNALHNAMLFAANDDIPGLNVVRFEYRPDGAYVGLTLIATDRYALSFQTIRAGAQVPEEFDFTITMADAKAMVMAHRKGRFLALTVDPGAETVRVVGDVTTEHKLRPDDFPKWASILPGQEGIGPVEAIAFNPKFLAKLGKIRQTGCRSGSAEPVRFAFYGNPNKPSTAQFSSGPTVLIMPVKLSA